MNIGWILVLMGGVIYAVIMANVSAFTEWGLKKNLGMAVYMICLGLLIDAAPGIVDAILLELK